MTTPIEIEKAINEDPALRQLLSDYVVEKFGFDNIHKLDNAMQYYQYPIAINILPTIVSDIADTMFRTEFATNVAKIQSVSHWGENFKEVKPLVENKNAYDECLTAAVMKAAISYASNANIRILDFETIVNECNFNASKELDKKVKEITEKKARDLYGILVLAIKNIWDLRQNETIGLQTLLTIYKNDSIPILNEQTMKEDPVRYVSAIALSSRPYKNLTQMMIVYSAVRTPEIITRVSQELVSFLKETIRLFNKFKTYYKRVRPTEGMTAQEKDALVIENVISKLIDEPEVLQVLSKIFVFLNPLFEHETQILTFTEMYDRLIEKEIMIPGVDRRELISTPILASYFKDSASLLRELPITITNGTQYGWYYLYDSWFLPRKVQLDKEEKIQREATARAREEKAKQKREATQAVQSAQAVEAARVQQQVANLLENVNVRRVTRSGARRAAEAAVDEEAAIAQNIMEAAQRIDGMLGAIAARRTARAPPQGGRPLR